MTKVAPSIVDMLSDAVKSRGMLRLLTHEVIGKGLFSTAWSSGVSPLEAWDEQLRNREDLELVGIFAQRVLADYDATPIPLRQAMTYQKALQKHQACGAFLWFLSSLQKMAPSEMWPEIDKSLRSQFSQGYMDPDLLHALETQVPPGDLKSLGAFRPFVAKIEGTARRAKEEKDAQLAQNLREADFAQLKAKVEADLATLESQRPKRGLEAEQHALDMKYLRDRKGKQYVDDWMGKHCCIVEAGENFDNGIARFLKFKELFRKHSASGEEYTICLFDATVFPANATYVAQAVKTLTAVLSMSGNNMGFVQFPVYQSQTSKSAMLKHRHQLEMNLLKGGLSLIHPVQILFNKLNCTASDKRALAQPALACFHTHFSEHSFTKSNAVTSGTLGPCPLLKVGDFLGYDGETTKPGASARVEQTKGVECHVEMLAGILGGMPFDDSDTVLIVDILPNRFAEFGRAAVKRNLEGAGIKLRYFAFMMEEVEVNRAAMRGMVHEVWDKDPNSPPKQRPNRESSGAADAPSLELLAWQDGRPYFPDSILSKFADHTPEFQGIQKLKKTFEDMFPAAAQPAPVTGSGRAGGVCDFSLDDGKKPLDLTRCIDLPMVSKDEFAVTRLAEAVAVGKRPHVVISSSYEVWIGNLTDSASSPACFRYTISPVDSKKTNVFKPNALPEDRSAVRHQTLGAVFIGHMDRLIENKRASLVWEALVL
ncbi:FO synthase subunit 1 [Durusdinium trenchii]|uniref:FO synthase subunit 1 n=1 Tax=Durusdinium trenchii TaxID=1381693 RepID=A0ABP0K6P4_9DINO